MATQTKVQGSPAALLGSEKERSWPPGSTTEALRWLPYAHAQLFMYTEGPVSGHLNPDAEMVPKFLYGSNNTLSRRDGLRGCSRYRNVCKAVPTETVNTLYFCFVVVSEAELQRVTCVIMRTAV